MKNPAFQHPDDGFYMIEPLGEHPNAEAGVIQIIDQVAAQSIVETFNADADQANFAGMLVDHEHFADDPTKESIAYGWMQRLEARADGIYGKIRWTTTGQAAVDGGDYRFFSTTYDPSDFEVIDQGPPQMVRPLRLDGLTLTNKPNNKGGKPVTNRAKTATESLTPASAFQLFQQKQAKVRNRLGKGANGLSVFRITREENPELFAAMSPASPGRPSGVSNRASARTAAVRFNAKVAEVRNRLGAGCDGVTAYQIAKRENPALFASLSQ